MNFDALIFDLDGTLVDSIGLYEEASCYMMRTEGVDLSREDFRHIYNKNIHTTEMLEMYSINKSEKEMRKIRDDYYMDLLSTKIEWFPDAKKCIESMSPEITRGIMTGSWHMYVDAINKRIPIRQLFQTIIACEDFRPNGKPKPDGILMVAERLNVDPKNCIYIGDQLFDAKAAENAGMTSCLVHRLNYSPKMNKDDADIVVDSLEELDLY